MKKYLSYWKKKYAKIKRILAARVWICGIYLVLAVVRHATGTNWDRLHLMANGDRYVRKIMGVDCTRFGIEEMGFSIKTS